MVDPPHAEGESHARDADEHGVQSPALTVHHGRQGCHRTDDALAQRNDGKEAVALGNVMCRCRASRQPDAGPTRAGQFNEYQDAASMDGVRGRRTQDNLRHPPDLGDRDGGGVGEAYPAARGIIQWPRAATETRVPHA